MRDAASTTVAEVVVGESAEENEARRERVRQMMKQKAQDEEVLPTVDEEEEEEEEESEYEEDSDYEEEEDIRRPPPPLFVPKSARETIAEKERLEKELEEQELQKLKQLEERKNESRQLLIETIKKEKEEAKAEEASEELADDVDDEENVEEYEQWKLRELRRIKREKEEREAFRKEQEEVAKRRGLTDEEVARMDRELLKPKEKPKMKFLQKYYHRGAFFGDDPLLTRDYTAPTGEDRIDKTLLPAVMQVKNFGRAGRTKWTHLVAEDTTKWDAGWASKDSMRTYAQKMGGMGPVDDPRRKYKRKLDQPPPPQY
jgi:microfibrillar-associated protein 1